MVNNTNFIPRLRKYTDKLGNPEVEKIYASGFMNLGSLTVRSIKQIKGVLPTISAIMFQKPS